MRKHQQQHVSLSTCHAGVLHTHCRFLHYERGVLTNLSHISKCTENRVRRFAWLHDNVSVLKTFLSQCVLRCHLDTVSGGGSSGAPQYQHSNVVSRGNRPAHVILSTILCLLHLLKGDLWLGFELPTPYIHVVRTQRPLGGGARRRRGLYFCAAQCEFKSHERVPLLHTL